MNWFRKRGDFTPQKLTGLLSEALADPEPGVRIQALVLAEQRPHDALVRAAVRRVDDPDPKVRLQLACAIGAWPQPEAGLALVETGTGRVAARLTETGYAAIPALAACASRGAPFPAALTRVRAESENYYPVTLQLLALAALNARYPACAPR